MRIGIDIRPLMSGVKTGVGEYTYELLNALFSLDSSHEFFLFYNAYGRALDVDPSWKAKKHIHIVARRLPNKLLNSAIAAVGRPRIDRMIAEELDVFFSPNIHFTSVSSNTKHILTIHDLSFEHFPTCYSWKRRMWHRAVRPKEQCRRADRIVTPSVFTKKDIVATYGIDPKKITVIHPGLSQIFSDPHQDRKREIRARYALPEKYILYLGTIEPRKNIHGLIDAFVLSGLKDRGYTLVIAGARGWKSTSVMQKIQKTEGVRSIGYVDARDKPELFRLARLFVYLSLYEGFGLPVLEAMAVGTPVLTSDRASLPEVAGAAARLVSPLNIAEMADAMRVIVSSDRLADIYAHRGRERSQRFDWDASARTFLSLMEMV